VECITRRLFDRVLLDPPCSGLGNRPRFGHESISSSVETFHLYQQRLFKVAFNLLAPGGLITFSTCTINPTENEGMVAWALAQFPDLELCPIPEPLRLGSPGLEGLGLNEEERSLVQRFDPTSELDSIGFFL